MASKGVKIVFGAMTMGREGAEQARIHSLDDCATVLDVFQRFGHSEIDVARTYAGGSSEEYLGSLKWQDRGLIMDTKISPKAPAAAAAKRYTHKPEDLRRALGDSLAALKADRIDLWYLHAPDHLNPYEDTLREVNNLYEQGFFRRFGISNYSAWETAQICEICIRNGWKKPDVYQGVYNALHRAVEPELFPCLRYYGIAFYGYNPVAGGLLTDKYQRDTTEHERGSRFDPHRSQGTNYRNRYWNDTYFDALDLIRPTASRLGLSTAEAALRWARYHSELREEHGDAIIVGASSAEQLEQNLASLDKGPLPEEMVKALDEGWDMVRAVTRPYFR